MPSESAKVTTATNKAVDDYLTYVATGKLPTRPGVETEIERLEARIADATRMVDKVQLIAKRHALQNPQGSAEELEARFIKYAPAFSERHGVTYAVWREMGVTPKVLEQAGIKAGSPGSAGYINRHGQPHGNAGLPRKRYRNTPEFVAEVRQTFEDAGGEANLVPAMQALVDKYEWRPAYMPKVAREYLGLVAIPYSHVIRSLQPRSPERVSPNGMGDGGTD